MKYLMPFFIGYVLISCNSENNQDTKPNIGTQNKISVDTILKFTDYFDKQLEHNLQIFHINSNIEQQIKGKQGTIITFPKNLFGFEHVTLKIELVECYSIQDMIFNNLSTKTRDGKILESDGMIYLNALGENGDTLIVKNGKLKIRIPTVQRKNDIKIFKGFENEERSIVWELSDENLEVGKKNIIPYEVIDYTDTSSISKKIHDSVYDIEQPKIYIKEQVKNENLANYIFNISKMGWINCDRYIEGETKDLFVNVSEEQQSVSLYLILDKFNSNLLPRNSKAVNGQIEFGNIPLNESFTLVALATKGDEIYFGMVNHSTNNGTIDCPELKPVTRQELTDILFEKFGKNIWNRPLG